MATIKARISEWNERTNAQERKEVWEKNSQKREAALRRDPLSFTSKVMIVAADRCKRLIQLANEQQQSSQTDTAFGAGQLCDIIAQWFSSYLNNAETSGRLDDLPTRADPVEIGGSYGRNYHQAAINLIRSITSEFFVSLMSCKSGCSDWAEEWPAIARRLAARKPFEIEFVRVALNSEISQAKPDSGKGPPMEEPDRFPDGRYSKPRCPIVLAGDGRTVLVYGAEKRLRKKQYSTLRVMIQQFDPNDASKGTDLFRLKRLLVGINTRPEVTLRNLRRDCDFERAIRMAEQAGNGYGLNAHDEQEEKQPTK